jgi:hypothetical protein
MAPAGGATDDEVLCMRRGLVGRAWLAALLVVAAGLGCGGGGDGGGDGDDTPGDQKPIRTRPGMGPSKERPEGTPYTLPAGVELERPIQGDDPFCVPEEQEEKEQKGSGGAVRLCLQFRNTTQQPILVQFPPGLIFISDQDTIQNGLLVQLVTIEVPARQQPFFVPLYLYCLNKDRRVTQCSQDTYSLGPVTQDAAIMEFIQLLQGKTLPLVDNKGTVQGALWNITDGPGLTPADRDALGKL